MPAKPVLGQHWLNHQPSLQAMTAAANLKKGERVLEIGTGLGYLTDELLKTEALVVSLEYDHGLYKKMLEKYDSVAGENLKLIEADIRKFDWRTLEAPYKICANIPYYLTANLLRSLIDTILKPELAVLMMSEDVALKLAEEKRRSLLAVLVQSHYKVELGQTVDRELFQPPPAVTSMIVVLRLEPAFKDCSQDNWLKLSKLFRICFSSRRKQIGVNLRHFFDLSKNEIADIFDGLDTSPEQRAEEFLNEQWWQLFLKIQRKL